MTPADLEALRGARALLEHPGLAARFTNLIGSPIERGLDLLPAGWNQKVGAITKAALVKAADVAIFTLKDQQPHGGSSNRWHKLSVAATGGVGGFFGMAGLAVELPVSTTIMMRSIADIARSEGESPSNPDTRLACLEVFALGGKSASDDGTDSGYYIVRAALAQAVGQASEYVAGSAAGMAAPPALMRLITVVAQRFGIQVTEKAAAQAVPAIGAAGGALINTLFIDHFQDMARGHFTIRRLERTYGKDVIRRAYDALE